MKNLENLDPHAPIKDVDMPKIMADKPLGVATPGFRGGAAGFGFISKALAEKDEIRPDNSQPPTPEV
ncbi:MAG TPA: hypothetical protein VK534_00410 [Methylomirabilota bacterium]|nr:hypothetical protein [Methylomirabilota bacterium]